MVVVLYCDDEPDSFITFNLVYNSDQQNNLLNNLTFLFDFQVSYTRALEPDSDEEEDFDNWDSRTVRQRHEFDRNWLIGGDKAQIQDNVYQILDMIDVPSYRDIVNVLTIKILELKNLDEISELPKVEKIEVNLDVVVWRFPDNLDDDVVVDVKLAVDPASKEAVEKHLETVIVRNEEYCVICMDKIRVGSDGAAGRMPCMHVFHRTCGEEWLRNSGSCPVCRAMFPS